MPYQQNGIHSITVTFSNDERDAELQASAAYSISPNGETCSPTLQLVGELWRGDSHRLTNAKPTITATPQIARPVPNNEPHRSGDRAGDIDHLR
jgi:hypothetical protein